MDNILELSEDGKTIIGVNDEKITHITIPDGPFWVVKHCKALTFQTV